MKKKIKKLWISNRPLKSAELMVFVFLFSLALTTSIALAAGLYGGGDRDGYYSKVITSPMYHGGDQDGHSSGGPSNFKPISCKDPDHIEFNNAPADTYAGSTLTPAPEVLFYDDVGQLVAIENLLDTVDVDIEAKDDQDITVPFSASSNTTETYNYTIGGVVFDNLQIDIIPAQQPLYLAACATIPGAGQSCATTLPSTFTLSSPIKINQPNGGENWEQGTTKQIRWQTYGGVVSDTFKIYIDVGDGYPVNPNYVEVITGNPKIFDWDTPTLTGLADQCKVKIEDWYNSAFVDESDSAFTLIPTYVIGAPAENDRLSYGATHTISWTPRGNSGPVKIELSLDDGNTYPFTLATDVDNDDFPSIYSWDTTTTPGLTGSTECRIRIVDDSDEAESIPAVSDVFTIQKFQIAFPNDPGQRFPALPSETYTDIDWMGILSPTVDNRDVTVEYSYAEDPEDFDDYATTIETNIGDGGWKTTLWDIDGADVTSRNYRVRIKAQQADSKGNFCEIISDKFTVYGKVTVTHPNEEGLSWDSSELINITWGDPAQDYGTIERVNVYYSTDSGTPGSWESIRQNYVNSGTVTNWDPESTSSNYRIIVEDAADEYPDGVYDMSDNDFVISGMEFVSPAPNAKLKIGDPVNITWNAEGPNTVKIELIDKDGNPVSPPIATGVTNDNGIDTTYPWPSVRDYPGDNLKIKVTSEQAADTNASVSIKIVPVVTVTSPQTDDDDLFFGGSKSIEWNTNSSNVSYVKIEYSPTPPTGYVTLIDSTENDGVWPWDPIEGEISERGKIRVQDVSEDHFQDPFKSLGCGYSGGAPSGNFFLLQSTLTIERPIPVEPAYADLGVMNQLYTSEGLIVGDLYICEYEADGSAVPTAPIQYTYTGDVDRIGILIAVKNDKTGGGEYSVWRNPATLAIDDPLLWDTANGDYNWDPPNIFDSLNGALPTSTQVTWANDPFIQNDTNQPYPVKMRIYDEDTSDNHPDTYVEMERPFGLGYLKRQFNVVKLGTESPILQQKAVNCDSTWLVEEFSIIIAKHYYRHLSGSVYTTTFTIQNEDYLPGSIPWSPSADPASEYGGKYAELPVEMEYTGTEIVEAKSSFFYDADNKILKALAWLERYGSKFSSLNMLEGSIGIYDIDPEDGQLREMETLVATKDAGQISDYVFIFDDWNIGAEYPNFDFNKLYYVETTIRYSGTDYTKGESVNFATLLGISQVDDKIDELSSDIAALDVAEGTRFDVLNATTDAIADAVGAYRDETLYDKAERMEDTLNATKLKVDETYRDLGLVDSSLDPSLTLKAKIYTALGTDDIEEGGDSLYKKLQDNIGEKVAELLQEQQTKILNGDTTIMATKPITIRFRVPDGLTLEAGDVTISATSAVADAPSAAGNMLVTASSADIYQYPLTISPPETVTLPVDYEVICRVRIQDADPSAEPPVTELWSMDSMVLTVTETDIKTTKDVVDNILARWEKGIEEEDEDYYTAEDIRGAISNLTEERPLSEVIDGLIAARWGDLDADALKVVMDGLADYLGHPNDTYDNNATVFGRIEQISDIWGEYSADDLYNKTTQAYDLITDVREELGTEEWDGYANTTVYGRLITLQSYTDSVEGTLGLIQAETNKIADVLFDIATLDDKIGIADDSTETIYKSITAVDDLIGTLEDTKESDTLFGRILAVAAEAEYLRESWDTIDMPTVAAMVMAMRGTLGSESDTEDSNTVFGRFAAMNAYLSNLEILVGSITDPATADTLFGKMNDVGEKMADEKILSLVGSPSDSELADTMFGKLKDIAAASAGISTAQTSAQSAVDGIEDLREELGTEGKTVTAYEILISVSDDIDEIKEHVSSAAGTQIDGATVTAGVFNRLAGDVADAAEGQGLVGIGGVEGGEALAGITPEQAGDSAEVKNRLEEIRTVLEVIKQSTVKEEEPVIKTWFE